MAHSIEVAQVPHPHVYNVAVSPVLRGLTRLYGGITTHNAQEVLSEVEPPYIIAPVHRSRLDIPIIALAARDAANVQLHFMAKAEFWGGLIGQARGRFFEAVGGFKVDRNQALTDDTLSEFEAVVNKRGAIGIFPEGECSTGENIDRKMIKRTVAALAMCYELPLVPVGISGTEPGHRGDIHVVFGDPIAPVPSDHEINMSEPRSYARITRPLVDELHSALETAQKQAITYQRY